MHPIPCGRLYRCRGPHAVPGCLPPPPRWPAVMASAAVMGTSLGGSNPGGDGSLERPPLERRPMPIPPLNIRNAPSTKN
jgi:hypothetical protein